MDPNATVALINQHLDDGDLEEAQEALNNLSTWLESGGFKPENDEKTSDTLIRCMSHGLWPTNPNAWVKVGLLRPQAARVARHVAANSAKKTA